MGGIVFILVLAASFIIVRIGAVAFQLTGLEWSLAKFQSLSCFSGTGFTTKEAELITGHPLRRRIASVLMVLGNAGLVTLVATAATSLNPKDTAIWQWFNTLIPWEMNPWIMQSINIGILVIAVYVTYRIFTNERVMQKMTGYLRKKIMTKDAFKLVSLEEFLLLTDGYGITRVEVAADSTLAGKTLIESNLRQHDITIMAIVRKDTTIPNPAADTTIQSGDTLISFGKLANIRSRMSQA